MYKCKVKNKKKLKCNTRKRSNARVANNGEREEQHQQQKYNILKKKETTHINFISLVMLNVT